MATMLDNYKYLRGVLDESFKTTAPTTKQILQYQEILYRIEVLEAMQMFMQAAPEGNHIQYITQHYQMLDAYVQNLLLERRMGTPADEEQQKKRDTSIGNLQRVVADYRKRLSSFRQTEKAQYKTTINSVVCTVLPAWISVRNTFVRLEQEAA